MIRWPYKIAMRIRSLFRRNRVELRLGDEIRFHLDNLIEEKLAEGMTAQEARNAALREMGGIDQIKEECRDVQPFRWLEALVRDVRYGIRMFRKNPGFSLAVIITLALCIGANTAIYSMLDALIFKPLPFPESDRIVSVYILFDQDDAKSGLPLSNISQFLDFKENTDVFEYLSLQQVKEFNLALGDDAFRYSGMVATSGIFDVFGLNPVLGRFF